MKLTASTRVAATALSFALCFVYLLFLPSHAWGLAALIAVGTLVLISVGHAGYVGVGGSPPLSSWSLQRSVRTTHGSSRSSGQSARRWELQSASQLPGS
jgi:hypothetical protein